MSLIFNNTEVASVIYNGVELDEIIFNGIQIYASSPNPFLTFSSPSSFTIAVYGTTKYWNGTLEYSTDKSTWNIWDGTTTLSSGSNNKLYLRGINNTVITGSTNTSTRWVLAGSNISCRGNIETLLDYQTVINDGHPTMGDYCYTNMFRECTSLTTAPALSATTLTQYCYQSMFYNCTSLTTPPALPATTLANYCYYNMFNKCTRLITAPALPATTLKINCYNQMFYGCTSLTTPPALPATTLTQYCYKFMFYGCTSLTTAPALPATTLDFGCYYKMFYNCTSLTTIPALPATILTSYCYNGMFNGCKKIKLSDTQTGTYTQAYRIPTSGTGTTASNDLTDMFTNTGGTFKSTPIIDTTYYLDSNNIIISAA